MTVYSCACSSNKEVLLWANQPEHSCGNKQKQSCCSAKQTQQHKQHQQLIKKICCVSESIAVKTEHQPEQVRLNTSPTGYFQPAILADMAAVAIPAVSDNVTGSLNRQVIPPKIPIFYQHSCLRL